MLVACRAPPWYSNSHGQSTVVLARRVLVSSRSQRSYLSTPLSPWTVACRSRVRSHSARDPSRAGPSPPRLRPLGRRACTVRSPASGGPLTVTRSRDAGTFGVISSHSSRGALTACAGHPLSISRSCTLCTFVHIVVSAPHRAHCARRSGSPALAHCAQSCTLWSQLARFRAGGFRRYFTAGSAS